MFIDIHAVRAEIGDCTMLDEIAQRLGREVQTLN
ncbi:hypothetical protein GGC64_006209 [Mycobacterium sp. OAS707]|nr:hypothetical protein [Mycobacterium sp. OAS707]